MWKVIVYKETFLDNFLIRHDKHVLIWFKKFGKNSIPIYASWEARKEIKKTEDENIFLEIQVEFLKKINEKNNKNINFYRIFLLISTLINFYLLTLIN